MLHNVHAGMARGVTNEMESIRSSYAGGRSMQAAPQQQHGRRKHAAGAQHAVLHCGIAQQALKASSFKKAMLIVQLISRHWKSHAERN